MTHFIHLAHRQLLIATVATSLSACGGDDSGPGQNGSGGDPGGGSGGAASSGGTDVGGTGGQSTGAGGDSTGTGGTTPTDSAGCVSMSDQDFASLLSGLNTEPATDYIGALTAAPDYLKAENGHIYLAYESSGEVCSGAVDRPGCEAQVDQLLTNGVDGLFETPLYLITTKDGAQLIGGRDAFLSLLGTIDTPNEAVTVYNHYVPCAAVSKAEGGYEITETAYSCASGVSGSEETFRIFVSSAGKVENPIPGGYDLDPSCGIVD